MTDVINGVIENMENLVKITCSDPISGEYSKQVFRRIEGDRFILEMHKKDKVFHEVFEGDEIEKCLKTRIIGYDLKQDVVENCSRLAEKYKYEGLSFEVADVTKDKLYSGRVDVVVSLHACDTATDYALEFAIKQGAKYIFSVPCCQHEINSAIAEGGDFDIMLGHGLIKERFSALLTDAVRCEVLENEGYKVDCLEFVGFDASPKNLMIRAVKRAGPKGGTGQINQLLKKYHASQTLALMREEAEKENNDG